jgi:hypothetical protein
MTDRHYARVKEGFTFSNCRVKKKNYLKIVPKAASEFLFRLSFAITGRFAPAGFQKNFKQAAF